jgi:hypothetical protein
MRLIRLLVRRLRFKNELGYGYALGFGLEFRIRSFFFGLKRRNLGRTRYERFLISSGWSQGFLLAIDTF